MVPEGSLILYLPSCSGKTRRGLTALKGGTDAEDVVDVVEELVEATEAIAFL